MLQNTKAKLEQTKSEFEDLRWANDALELRFGKVTNSLSFITFVYYTLIY